MPKGQEALQGALNRLADRSSNDLPVDELRAKQDQGQDWSNWPDWSNNTDFPNWENIGGNPPTRF